MNGWIPKVTVHTLIIVISLLIYVLTTRLERTRRPPSIAIAWVLSLIALPYFALPAYLIFGRRKLRRKTAHRSGTQQGGLNWAEELIESFGLAASAPAFVRLHRDGVDSSAALFATMASARSRLDICTYILGNDAIGREATRYMVERARAGVRVRLLIDGVGAIKLPRSCFHEWQQAGIETAVFSPLFARRTPAPRNLRNHRKLTIADGVRLWAGGRNLAAEYFVGGNGVPAWRDLTFDLDGPVAAAATDQFEADWVAAGGNPAISTEACATADASVAADAPAAASVPAGVTDPSDTLIEAAPCRAQFVPSGPDQAEDTVQALLIDACFRARRRIIAVTPYFVPDAALEMAMRLAARRGVRIDLCIPATSNHRLPDFVRHRALRSLSEVGARVHLSPYMNHAKAVVFDRSLAVSGSVNLDSRSLLLNFECAVVFYGVDEIDWLANWIQDLIPESRPYDCRAPGLWRDIAEGLLLTVAYQL
ncbi:MAG: phospholipase D-like domain-containing protein [Gammaproteobacteria bacterium]